MTHSGSQAAHCCDAQQQLSQWCGRVYPAARIGAPMRAGVRATIWS